MAILADNFLRIKNRFIAGHLVNFDLSRIDFFSVKSSVSEQSKGLTLHPQRTRSYCVILSKDIFFKSLLNEAIQFYLRICLQYNDLNNIKKSTTKSWLLVTNYYMAFFCITGLFRILHKGFVYIDSSDSRKISNVFSTLASETIQVDSGYYFFRPTNNSMINDIEIEFCKTNGRVHESSWNSFYEDVCEMSQYGTDLEKVILEKIKDMFDKYGKNLMSQLRNEVNYRGEYACREIRRQFHYNLVEPDAERLGRNIIKASLNNTIDSRSNCMNLISMYLFCLVGELFGELIERNQGKPDCYKIGTKQRIVDFPFKKSL